MAKIQKLESLHLPPKSGTAKQLVVFLHGYGANGADLLSMGGPWAEELPDAVFVAPNAPQICEAFATGYQWFSLRAVDRDIIEREKPAQAVLPTLNAYLDSQLEKWGVEDSGLAVAGFSQGAMMALYAMPRRAKPCAGVIGYSGMIIDANGLKAPGIQKFPVLAIHGDGDEVVTPENLDLIQQGFEAAGFDVETVMRPGLGHGIDHFGLVRGVDFLKESFEKSQKNVATKARAKL